MRRVPYYNQARVYSNSWNYPGYYEGAAEHPPKEEVIVDTTVDSPDDYSYIDVYEGYPYDIEELDKTIDIMEDPSPTFYDLMDNTYG